jgi:hypothetical protein
MNRGREVSPPGTVYSGGMETVSQIVRICNVLGIYLAICLTCLFLGMETWPLFSTGLKPEEWGLAVRWRDFFHTLTVLCH